MIQASYRHHRLAAGALLSAALAVPAGVASAASITDSYFVGVGDSYTATYTDRSSRNDHRSWLDQLDAHHTGGGFTNLAISGTTTSAAIDPGHARDQRQDAVNAVTGRGAGVVFIGLGVNDFTDLLEGGTPMTQAQADAVADTAFANLTALVDALTSANPDVQFVIANSVDRGRWAGRSTSAFDTNRAVTTSATQRYNQLIADEFHHNRGMAVVDSYRLLEDLLAGDPADSNPGAGPGGTLFLAGQAITTDPTLSMGNDQPADHLWADPAHPGSVFQGLFANVVLTAVEATYGVDPGIDGYLSMDDIFATANLAGGATLTTANDPGYTFNYGAYVVPEPGSVLLLMLGGGLMVMRRRRA